MTALEKLQSQSQAIQRFRRRLKRLEPFADPSKLAEATRTADRLEAKVRARWGPRFGAFLLRVNGRGGKYEN